MKKFLACLLIAGIFSLNSCALALKTQEEEISIPEESAQTEPLTVHDDAPVWAEYVAPKYRNPRSDFKKGSSIAELSIGILLTELIITSPIGIPLTIHGTTKVKMVSYNNRKKIFDEEIPKAQLIEDDNERAAEYKRILKRCHLKESTKKHYAKKAAKAKKKAEKKMKKLEK